MSIAAATGVVRIARFEASGLASFDATPQGLLNALTPWLGFALVAAFLLLIYGEPVHALSDLLASVVALLAPPVFSHLLARFWGREERWLRYAVAVAWCQWVMPPALLAALTGSFMLIASGVPDSVAEPLAMAALLGYALALNVFLASRALDLSVWRAAGAVVLVNLATGALVLGPTLIAGLMDAAP